MNLYTTKQVAAIYGISARRVRQIAQARQLIAAERVGNVPLWTWCQVKQLKPGPNGRPPG